MCAQVTLMMIEEKIEIDDVKSFLNDTGTDYDSPSHFGRVKKR